MKHFSRTLRSSSPSHLLTRCLRQHRASRPQRTLSTLAQRATSKNLGESTRSGAAQLSSREATTSGVSEARHAQRGIAPMKLKRMPLHVSPEDASVFTAMETALGNSLLHSTSPEACEAILNTRRCRASVPEDPRYDGFLTSGNPPLPYSPPCAYFSVRPQSELVLFPFSTYPKDLGHGAPVKLLSIDASVLSSDGFELFYVSTTPTQSRNELHLAYTTNIAVVSRSDWEVFERFSSHFAHIQKENNAVFRVGPHGKVSFATKVLLSGSTARQHSVILSFVDGLSIPADKLIDVKDGVKVDFSTRGVRCPKCELQCLSLSTLKQHFRAVHMGIHAHLCTECGNRFSTERHLHQHLSAVHRGVRPYSCTKCDKAFSQKVNLAKHVDLVHGDAKRHVCVQCSKDFSELRYLNKHISSVHRKERPYRCHECSKRFSQMGVLTRHIAAVHP